MADGSVAEGLHRRLPPRYDHDPARGTLAPAETGVLRMQLGLGQSLAVGMNNLPGAASLTTTPCDPGWSLMFDEGPHPNGRPVRGFADLANRADRMAETAGPAMFGVVQARLRQDLGRPARLLWAVAARNARRYLELKRGTPTYAEALRLVARAAELAADEGWRVVVDALWIRHGEADAGGCRIAYAEALLRWRQDLEADIRRITGQAEPVRALLTQCTRGARAGIDPATPTAVLDAADRDPLTHCLGPIYFADHDPRDPGHPTAEGYVMLAEVSGHAQAELLWGPGFTPVRLRAVEWIAAGPEPVLELRYTRPVLLDASGLVVNPDGLAAAGFDVTEGERPVPVLEVAAPAPALRARVEGRRVEFGPGPPTRALSGLGARPWLGVTVTVGGVAHDRLCGPRETLGSLAAGLAAAIPGARAEGTALLLPAGGPIAARVAGDRVTLRLARPPRLAPRLFYACQATGRGGGARVGPRGLVREWRKLGVSAAGAERPLHHWACVEARALPGL